MKFKIGDNYEDRHYWQWVCGVNYTCTPVMRGIQRRIVLVDLDSKRALVEANPIAHGIPSKKVIGTGYTLDTDRLRTYLGRISGFDSSQVHVEILGEYGDRGFLAWSSITLEGIPLESTCNGHHNSYCSEGHQEIEDLVW